MLPAPGLAFLDGSHPSNESNQVFYAAIPHHLVEPTHGILLEVLALPVRGVGFHVLILLIDKHSVGIALQIVRNVVRAARLLRDALHGDCADSRICQTADAEIVECCASAGPYDRTVGTAARFSRLLCTQRAASVAFDVLMTAIPAQVAGVERIVAVSPKPAPETLAAAHLLGITEFYRLGGAHAVAALAYGTATLPRVDKIVGPGNLYVTAAKRLVAFDCAIDMLAGPTEIVVTSESGRAEDIASDLVAQAEHDPEALAIFVTTREELARAVIAETKVRSRENAVAREALKRNGLVIVAGSVAEARAITNRLAAEHLTVDAASDLEWVENAGSVFVGRWSAQPMGDYISGPNHTLPTGGMARVRGGLSVNDFVKLITVQEYTAEGVRALGPKAALLAEAEGMIGHAEASGTRLREIRRRKRRSRG